MSEKRATCIRCSVQRQFGKESRGTLIEGDALARSSELIERFGGQVQCIYLDPPFGTGKRFDMKVRVGEKDYKNGTSSLTVTAYADKWESIPAYLEFMRDALTVAWGLLSREGVIFVHVDPKMSSKIRAIMDDIFGESNFLNEIVWSYQTGGRAKTYFPRKHDTILFYAKTRKYYFDLKSVPVARRETRSNHMRRGIDEDGRAYSAITSGGKEYRYYDDEPAYPGDVWDDISHLQQRDPERTGFETQKPLKLLDRILRCSTREGDLVCDFFAGSGTTAVAARELHRRFVCMDINPLAVSMANMRLSLMNGQAVEGYDVEAPCGGDDCVVQAEVFPAISSYTMHLISYDCPAAAKQGIEGLNAVAQWSAGFVQGDVFQSCVSSVRTHMHPKLDMVLEMPVCAGEPCLMIVDIWGTRRFYLPKRSY